MIRPFLHQLLLLQYLRHLQLKKNNSSGNLIVSWNANNESDISGYKIHYGNYTGYSFANTIDIGNVTSYNLSGLVTSIDSVVAVTAYDNSADGTDDMVEGNESWYAIADTPPEPISNLAAVVGNNNQVNLNWDASNSSNVSSYKVFRNGSMATAALGFS